MDFMRPDLNALRRPVRRPHACDLAIPVLFSILAASVLASCAGMVDAIGVTKKGIPSTIDSSPPLTRAIRIRDYDRAAALIRERRGLDERLPLETGSTPLELAALHGRLDLVRALIEAGGFPSDAAELALIRATWKGHRDIAEYLADKGVRVGSSFDIYKAVLDTRSPAVYRLLLDLPHPNFSLNRKGARIKFYQYGPLLPNAVILGDTALVEGILAGGAGIEETRDQDDYVNLTPLWLAAAYGRTEIALKLLEAGAKPDAADKNHKYTPLMLACLSGNRVLAERLIRKGAGVNMKSASAFTSGFETYGSYAVRTIADLKQRTPLMFAAEGGHADLVRLLLSAGADPDFRNDEGWSALDAARTNVDEEISRLLLSAGASENPLITAACSGDFGKLKELLPRLEDFLGTKKSPVYPLTLAVRWYPRHKSRAAIDVLAGEKGRLSPNDLRSAFGAAASDGDLLLYLSSKGISVNTDDYVSAPDVLKTHILRGNTEAFKALWEAEAATAPKGRSGRMLKEAVKAGALGITAYLLDQGGSPDAVIYGERYNLLGYAIAGGNDAMTALLLERGASVNPELANRITIRGPMLSPLMAAAEAGNAALVPKFLGTGADVNALGFEGRTALYYAAVQGDWGIVRILAEAGAPPDYRMDVLIPGSGGYYEAKGETALMAAARAGRSQAVRVLLQKGADPRLTDWIGDDALVMAVENGHEACAILLREALGAIR